MPDALSLVATYRNCRDAWGQAYCTFAGSVTVPRRVRLAPSTSTSYCVSSAPTLAYSHVFATSHPPWLNDDLRMSLGVAELGECPFHAIQPDMPGDQRRHVHLAVRNVAQARRELVCRVAQHELHVE